MSQPQVVSIVLNTNRRQDTLECLTSLQKLSYPNHSVIVLDNASTDGSTQAIAAAFPAVQIVTLTENRGYTGNNNVGIKLALSTGASWVLVLNEDTVLETECMTRLVEVGESESDIGFVGPMVYHHDEPTVIQSAGGRFDKWWVASHLGQNQDDVGQFTVARDVDWVSGCAIMVRRAVIEQLGSFDERLFYYYDETEWCMRASKRGWRVVHVPAAKLWHKGVQRDYHPAPSVTYYATRNRLSMLARHRAPLIVWLMAWWQILRTLASWTIKRRWRLQRDHRNAMWRGAIDFLQNRWGQMPK